MVTIRQKEQKASFSMVFGPKELRYGSFVRFRAHATHGHPRSGNREP